jgi:hypothetical protein
MKKNFYLLAAGFVLYGVIGGSCTKDNAQPYTYSKKNASTSSNAAAAVPVQPPTASTTPPSSECSQHPH